MQRSRVTVHETPDDDHTSNNHHESKDILTTSSFHHAPTRPYSNSSAGSDAMSSSTLPPNHTPASSISISSPLLANKVPDDSTTEATQQHLVSSTTTSPSLSNNSPDTDDEYPREKLNCTQHTENTCRCCSSDNEIVPMTVDTCEHFWTRMHDVRIHGSVLEYTGVGNTIHDNGFAQSNVPLTPINHYFEITILDPGENCYIAIGLARKDYNVHSNPGWCRGSIAYHADDGKIFIGGGVGTPFGPRCSVNDILGCGIVFPEKYGEMPVDGTWPWDDDDETTTTRSSLQNPRQLKRQSRRMYSSVDNFGYPSDSEDDIWWDNKNHVCEDKVKVFFMRNRKLLGIKEVRIPKGGFFPTIGMMSANERVSVDLNPLTG